MAHVELRVLRIEVVYCPKPGHTDRMSLHLPEGSKLRDALAASGLSRLHELSDGALQAGIWGRVRPADTELRDLDRVELYRPLQVDPKEARRLRSKRAKRVAPG